MVLVPQVVNLSYCQFKAEIDDMVLVSQVVNPLYL